jgi:hypothetical protein
MIFAVKSLGLCQRNGMLAHADAELSASSTLPRHDSLVEGMGSHPRSPVRIDTQRRWEGPAKVGFATDSPVEGNGFEHSVPRLR